MASWFNKIVRPGPGLITARHNPGLWLITSFVFVTVSFALFILVGCGDLESEIVSFKLSPPIATIGINHPQLFTVIAKDSLDQIVSVVPTWSVTGEIGTISSGGLFIAAARTGEGFVRATANGLTAEAVVTVTDLGWIQGRVVDSVGNLVPNLKVYLFNSSNFDFTDSSGKYSISQVPAGTYSVWTTQTSVYRAASAEAVVTSGEATPVNFTILYFVTPADTNPPDFNP